MKVGNELQFAISLRDGWEKTNQNLEHECWKIRQAKSFDRVRWVAFSNGIEDFMTFSQLGKGWAEAEQDRSLKVRRVSFSARNDRNIDFNSLLVLDFIFGVCRVFCELNFKKQSEIMGGGIGIYLPESATRQTIWHHEGVKIPCLSGKFWSSARSRSAPWDVTQLIWGLNLRRSFHTPYNGGGKFVVDRRLFCICIWSDCRDLWIRECPEKLMVWANCSPRLPEKGSDEESKRPGHREKKISILSTN